MEQHDGVTAFWGVRAEEIQKDDRTRVLKHADTFGVFDRFGDIQTGGLGEQGLYHAGTRFLSRWEFRLGGGRPFLLRSSLRNDNQAFSVDFMNPDWKNTEGDFLERGVLHVRRTKFLWQATMYEKVEASIFEKREGRVFFRFEWGKTILRTFSKSAALNAGNGEASGPRGGKIPCIR